MELTWSTGKSVPRVIDEQPFKEIIREMNMMIPVKFK